LRESGRRADAQAASRRAIELREALVRDFPAVEAYAVDLATSYVNFGNLILDGGDPQAALDWYGNAVERLRPVLEREPRHATARLLYDCGCVLARASAAIAGDPATAEKDAARAVALLRQAFATGHPSLTNLVKDPDLAPLRRRSDYFDLLWDLADAKIDRQG